MLGMNGPRFGGDQICNGMEPFYLEYSDLSQQSTCWRSHLGLDVGRWTKYLLSLADQVVLVDLAERCIEYCKTRFKNETHIEYFVNDGTSLDMIEDETLDFVFSYDSLVHAEIDVMQAYIEQLSKKLITNGVAFLHHSNIGEYQNMTSKLVATGKDHGRAFSVTAGAIMECIKKSGLVCISQETLNWGGRVDDRLYNCVYR